MAPSLALLSTALLLLAAMANTASLCVVSPGSEGQRWQQPCLTPPQEVTPLPNVCQSSPNEMSLTSCINTVLIAKTSLLAQASLLRVQRWVSTEHFSRAAPSAQIRLLALPQVDPARARLSPDLLRTWEANLTRIGVFLEHSLAHLLASALQMPKPKQKALKEAVKNTYELMCRVQYLHLRHFGPHAWPSARLNRSDILPAWARHQPEMEANMFDFLVARDAAAFFGLTSQVFRSLDRADTVMPGVQLRPAAPASASIARASVPEGTPRQLALRGSVPFRGPILRPYSGTTTCTASAGTVVALTLLNYVIRLLLSE